MCFIGRDAILFTVLIAVCNSNPTTYTYYVALTTYPFERIDCWSTKTTSLSQALPELCGTVECVRIPTGYVLRQPAWVDEMTPWGRSPTIHCWLHWLVYWVEQGTPHCPNTYPIRRSRGVLRMKRHKLWTHDGELLVLFTTILTR